MYEYLEGEIAGRSAAHLVLDVGGVGYDLLVPLSAAFPGGGKLRVWTHLVVREDAQQLYGFPDRATREWFRLLLSVSGVGPKIALGVVSGLSREDFMAALSQNDAARLVRVRGVGRRTAEQILLDLRDKAPLIAAADGPSARGEGEAARRTREQARREEAVTALIGIGYSEKEARKAVERALDHVGNVDLERLVRAALAG